MLRDMCALLSVETLTSEVYLERSTALWHGKPITKSNTQLPLLKFDPRPFLLSIAADVLGPPPTKLKTYSYVPYYPPFATGQLCTVARAPRSLRSK